MPSIIHFAFLYLAFIYLAHGDDLDLSDDGSGSIFTTELSAYGGNGEFIFAFSIATGNKLYFHMSAASEHSWMAVGIGEEMDGSVMFVAYKNVSKHGITISPRLASRGEAEPTYTTDIMCSVLQSNDSAPPGPANATSTMSVNAICNVPKETLDLNATAQPFMFALGHKQPLFSDDMDASMDRHIIYGNFDVNVTMATTSEGGVQLPNGPNQQYLTAGASNARDIAIDADTSMIAHAAMMCAAYVGLFPLGSLLLRLRNSVRLHAACQTLGAILAIAGTGLGIMVSTQYNRSKDCDSAHQVLGLVAMLALVMQWGLGTVHHLKFKRTKQRTMLGWIHL